MKRHTLCKRIRASLILFIATFQKWRKGTAWSFEVFTDILDLTIVVLLFASLLATGQILGTKKFTYNLLLLFSSLLCSGLCGKIQKRVPYISVWFLLVRILVDMYSGKVSSRLIVPSVESTLESTQELNE